MQFIANILALAAFATTASCADAKSNSPVPALERMADAGNAEALYYLGMAYQTGTGAPEDHAKALAAFRKAAALGDPLASYKLGCYYDGQDSNLAVDLDSALKHKLVAARAGYALAQHDVGNLYARQGNVAAGLTWLGQSAAQGWTDSLMAMASVYNGAPGVEPDAAITAAYFRIFLDRTEASVRQTEWFDGFSARLSPEDRNRADAIVREYQPVPTPLTLRALSGERAAQALVERETKE